MSIFWLFTNLKSAICFCCKKQDQSIESTRKDKLVNSILKDNMMKKEDGTAWRGAKEMSSNVFVSIIDVLTDDSNVIIDLTTSRCTISLFESKSFSHCFISWFSILLNPLDIGFKS